MILLLPAAAGADGQWVLESSDAAALYQDAGNTITDETATKAVRPRLEFSCTPGDSAVTAQIDWKRFISSFRTEVGFKVDDGQFAWHKWKVDRSEKVTVSTSPEDTRKLIDTLSDGKSLVVEITPYSEGPVVAEFDLAGFVAALGKLKDNCG